MSPFNCRYHLAFPGSLLAIALVLLPAAALAQTGTARTFSKGSLIIPTDNCYQGDVAQTTPPKAMATDPASQNFAGSACAGAPNANSVMANGGRRAYGLVWLLLKAGVPVYWIINPAKTHVDDPDLTLGTCGGSGNAATLVDPSLPGSYCGLDALHPVESPVSISGLGTFPSQCWDALNHGAANPTVGTIPLLNNGTAVSTVSYRGGPFVIDSSDAALARDVMAWYFVAPPAPATFVAPTPAGQYVTPPPPAPASIVRGYANPWATNNFYADPSYAGNLTAYPAAAGPFVEPGHHPLHWSDYTPSTMVPFYPSQAFAMDIGDHSVVWPCNDTCLCPYTTWDPLNPNGFVDPWAGTIGNGFGAPGFVQQNAITFATVNVHQAQVQFETQVAKVFDAPMAPIALAAMGDPVHINTFRLYLEEAGLTFGPCQAPPATWLGATSTGFAAFNPNDNGTAAGMGDRFFDPVNYPFPSNGLPGAASTFSQIPVTCAEGLNADPAETTIDLPTMQKVDAKATLGGGWGSMATAAPYGQVLDIIAPEPIPIQSILGPNSSNQMGCGTPTYQELWVPHWDAYLCSGPTTRNCPLAAQSSSCATSGTCLSGSWGSLTVSTTPWKLATGSGACANQETGSDGYDPYCPELVQLFLNAVQTYAWKGGNLLAECIGASSLEDFTFQRLLGEQGINQQITHFMSEWVAGGAINSYWPSQAYFTTAAPLPGGGNTEPTYGNFSSALGQDCIPLTASICDGQGIAGTPANGGNFCNATPDVALPINKENPAGLGVGWPGDQVQAGPGATGTPGTSQTIAIALDGQGGNLQYNSFTTCQSQNPLPTPYGPVNTQLCAACDWGTNTGPCAYQAPGGIAANTCPPNVFIGGGQYGCTNCQAQCQCLPTIQDPYHAIEYAPPAVVGAGNVGTVGVGASPSTKLSDPFLQVGDFYFEGIYGATESWTQGIANQGYATNYNVPDTLPLIRGFPSLTGLAIDTSLVDGAAAGGGAAGTGLLLHGDYWVKNHNSAHNGESGTVVYLQGDSFDGRPDGLRMIWSSMLNLGFLPNEVEIARSSAVVEAFGPNATPPIPTESTTYHNEGATPDNYLFQGTFVQANLPSQFGTVYSGQGNMTTFAFPAERGHFRQIDQTQDACLSSTISGGTFAENEAGGCSAGVVAGTNGSNTTSFSTPLIANSWQRWDTSGPDPLTLSNGTPTAELINDTVDAAGANVLSNRLIFSHMYQPLVVGTGIGIQPVWLNPANAACSGGACGPGGGGGLECALFPNAQGCPAPLNGGTTAANVACPDGKNCFGGPLACAACTCVGNNCAASGASPSLSNSACTSYTSCKTSDVGGLLFDVYRASGGCVPLLQDTCFSQGSSQLACLDQCWTGCYATCSPASNYPPLGPASTNPCSGAPAGFDPNQCGIDCAVKCNGAGNNASNCGVGTSPPLTIGSFRETCGPGLGGVDHSTPVIVGPPPSATIQEYYLSDPTNPASAQIPSACRPTVAYFGAADGMLHAVYIDDGPGGSVAGTVCDACSYGKFIPGQELWAFVPNQQLPLLATNGNCAHSLFVDGVPTVKDIYADLQGTGTPAWHTVLVETEGTGGNHVFALDVTDPLAPLRAGSAASCQASSATQARLALIRMVLWEDGDPLDGYEFRPSQQGANVTWVPAGSQPNLYTDDVVHEGPGFPQAGGGTVNSSLRKFNHYLGESAQPFLGQILGAGTHLETTYLAAQNGQMDGYGGAVAEPFLSTATRTPKDFSNTGAGTTYGPQGEVVYAFNTASGVPRSQASGPAATPTSTIEHYTELYMTAGSTGVGGEGYRSGGNNDIPAPAVGISLSGQPETELVVVPDLDGQVWGLLPSTLAPYRSLIYSGNTAAFPLFDIQRYTEGPLGSALYPSNPLAEALAVTAQGGALVEQAAFANPAAFLPPGTCATVQDPVLLLATGGVDWGPPVSIIVALDLGATNNNIEGCTGLPCTGVANSAVGNDSAASPIPQPGLPSLTPLEVATCPGGTTATQTTCVGRVFGQPLVDGQEVLYTTSTGSLTGVGADIQAQQGNGRIQALGSSSCTASTISTGSASCGICATGGMQANDLATNVGKVASGLAASSPNAAGTSQVFSSSTTGLSTVSIKATAPASLPTQKLLLQQYWLRRQERTPQ